MVYVLSFLFLMSSLNSQDIISDSIQYNLSYHAESYIDSIKSLDEYKYSIKKPSEPDLSFLEKIFRFFSFSEATKTILFYLLIFAVVMAIIYYFAKDDVAWIFKPKSQIVLNQNDIHVSDKPESYEDQLNAAIESHNFKLAIHFTYIHILSLLIKKKLITYSVNKTNREYLYELSTKEIKELFKQFTLLFEYFYYGEFEITGHRFEMIMDKYRDLVGALSK